MSCFFCSKNNHVSQNCDIYVSDLQRKEIVRQKNCCCNCLSVSDSSSSPNFDINQICKICFSQANHHAAYCPNGRTALTSVNTSSSNLPICRNCLYQRKCYICFSQDHHTVFCPDRLTTLNMFPPNIDKDLMSRFLILLTPEEKYLLCLSIPTYFYFMGSFKIKIQKEIVETTIKNVLDSDIVVADTALIKCNPQARNSLNVHNTGSIGLSPFKSISFRIRYLDVYQSPLSSIEFLQLLSSNTRFLICEKVEFLQKLTFREILQKAPILENIDIHQTNITVENTWTNDLLQFNHAKKLTKIHLKIDSPFCFNVEQLVVLMKKKSANIILSINVPPSGIAVDRIVKNKLSNHFKTYTLNSHSLTIVYVDAWFNDSISEKYELQNNS